MNISVIIPTLNEAETIAVLLSFFQAELSQLSAEVIVVDGGSTDGTIEKAKEFGVKVLNSVSGRGKQMNYGAQQASGDILYFVHADTLPPQGCLTEILSTVEKGASIGSYRTQFEKTNFALRVNAFFTRFNFIWCRGGDQSLFVSKELFQQLKGFRSDFQIMEDYDLIQRAKERAPFKILPREIKVSVRKYQNNSYLRVNLSNLLIFLMYFLGFSQDRMLRTYRRLLRF